MLTPRPRRPSSLAVAASLLVFAAAASAQAPAVPYGESSSFVLNTNRIGFGDSGVVMLVSAPEGDLQAVTALRGAIPNPFNPHTAISFTVAAEGRVELEIFDLRGRCLRQLVSDDLDAGEHTRVWNGRTDAGEAAPAGVYLVRLASGGATRTQKITLVK